jgi:hypothetical protein
MGCGCLIALFAVLSPRLAIFLTWIFTDRLSIALDSFWWGLAGFLFLPWTTLVYAWAYQPVVGVSGFGWFLVIFAFVVDISSHLSAWRARDQERLRRA